MHYEGAEETDRRTRRSRRFRRLTDRLRAGVDAWQDVFHLDDEQLAGQIRADRIDILVDLTLHMAGNCMLTFARRPARGSAVLRAAGLPDLSILSAGLAGDGPGGGK